MEEDARQDPWAFGEEGALRGQKNSYNKMGRRIGEKCGSSQHVSNISQENLSQWNLDSEELVTENKSLSSGKGSVAGGKTNKSHLEISTEQLVLELTLSEHAHVRAQNTNQGIFQLWNYPLNKGSTMDSREFKKSSVESGFSAAKYPRLFTLNHSLTSVPGMTETKQVGSYPGQSEAGLCWPCADGDSLKHRNEVHSNSYSTVGNNGDTSFASNWNMKCRNSSIEENVTDESDLSENEKMNDTLLSYFKKMDKDLKPETIEHVERSFTEEPNEVFIYADFLPHPFNTLDLHRFALSKCENWKLAIDPPETSIERLITRLLELERLQHMTIQKEKPRLPSTFSTPAVPVSERPSSSKAIVLKTRQLKLPDSLTLPTAGIDKSRDKRKNSGSGKLEHNTFKWNWSSAGKCKSNSRSPSLKCSSTAKQSAPTHDDFKNSKSSILNPCQELPPKPSTTQTTQSLVKVVSIRSHPPRSPVPVSPIPLSFPENQKEEIKAPRNKKKLHRKSILLNRTFYIQKQKCLSPSFLAKGKSSPTDQKS